MLRPPSALRARVLLGPPLGAALVVLGMATGLLGKLLTWLPYGHGFTKNVLGVVLTFGVRQDEWLGLGLGALAVGVLWPLLPRRPRAAASVALVVAAPLLLPHGSAVLAVAFAALVALNLAHPDVHDALSRKAGAAVWLPGASLLLPGWALRRAGLFQNTVLMRIVSPLIVCALTLGWLVLDSALSLERLAQKVSHWPAAYTDPRAQIVERTPERTWCQYHDIDIIGDHAIVVAEGTGHIQRWPLAGGPPQTVEVPRDWPPLGGLVMDSETDPATGRTWFLDGPDHISTLRVQGRQWQRAGRSPRLPESLHHTYAQWLPERGELVLFSINTRAAPEPPRVTLFNPGTGQARSRPLHDPSGAPVPNVREIAWIPPLERFVVAPDFGEHLYLVDPWTGEATPWLAVPTLNGKLVWSAERGELYMALPDRLHVQVIDPVAGAVVRRLPTQPGVRALAVDAERGVLLAGSVLTGTVLVQDLDTGRVVDHLGTFMPLMREIALVPGQPEAWLSTWGTLYRFTYDPG
ncbi:MAG: hypothetical protein H6739_27570 [Alphaproteobacteria bacterium]|nr:hypothetical protein [Alphaproteobacteria bacterium]